MQYEDNSFATGYALGQNSHPAYAYNNGGWGNGMFGNDAWWIIILLIFGWNGNNGGFGANGNGGFMNYEIGKLATQADIASGFSTAEIMSDLNDILLGQASIQQTLCQGFNGVNTAILQSANATERGFAQTNFNLQDCCCKIERGIDNINYNMAKNTCDILRSNQDQTQQILNYLTTDKIDTLNRKLATAEARNSQFENNAYLISQLREPYPIPAYRVPNPNCCYDFNYFDGATNAFGFGRNTACALVQ